MGMHQFPEQVATKMATRKGFNACDHWDGSVHPLHRHRLMTGDSGTPNRLSLLLKDRSPTLFLSRCHLGACFGGHLSALPRFPSCPWATPISSFGFGQDGTRLFENGNLSVNRGENLVSIHPAIVIAPFKLIPS
jgi:hypothetical protein